MSGDDGILSGYRSPSPGEREWKRRPRRGEPRHNGAGEAIGPTEDEVALAFAAEHAGKLAFDHTAGKWLEFDGAVWRDDLTAHAFDLARDFTRRARGLVPEHPRTMAKVGFATAVERAARSDRRLAISHEVWDRDPWLLGTPGGTVDLRTGELRRGDPGDFISRATTVPPAETVECPRWLKFVEEASGGDVTLMSFLQRWCGYCLTGITREHALVFAYGDGGNGKGTLFNTVARVMGRYATTAPMETFVVSSSNKHPTEIAALHGARLVLTTETEEGRAWAEAKLKALTGGDSVSARFMKRDFFEFTPQFKLTVFGNHKPRLNNVDDAARRRFNVVPFVHKPPVPDPHLEEALRAEWPGILRWMIEGCREWQMLGLVKPEAVKAATAQYFQTQDIPGAWVRERCILGPTLAERPTPLLADLNEWAERNGIKRFDRTRFRDWAECQPELRYKTVNGKDYVSGIGLKVPAHGRRRGEGGEGGEGGDD